MLIILVLFSAISGQKSVGKVHWKVENIIAKNEELVERADK